jgi:hypothetical protein
MRSKSRAVLVGLVAVLAVGAIASTAASGYTQAKGGGAAANAVPLLAETPFLEGAKATGAPLLEGAADDLCIEVPGAGIEPPIKYDNHECNSQEKPLVLRKWETAVCIQVPGAGVEPPVKYDNHECNSQNKPLVLRKWETAVCLEVPGAGKEPPIKYDNHECDSQEKPLVVRKWEWVAQ